jgi:hypothetical protein
MTNSCFGDYGELKKLSKDVHKFLASSGISMSTFDGSNVIDLKLLMITWL